MLKFLYNIKNECLNVTKLIIFINKIKIITFNYLGLGALSLNSCGRKALPFLWIHHFLPVPITSLSGQAFACTLKVPLRFSGKSHTFHCLCLQDF